MRRDRVFAATAEREARGGRHVLLLSGFKHLARLPRALRLDNALTLLERGAPGRVWVIVPYWGGGARGQARFERRYIAGRPPIQLRPLTGALGRRARRPDPPRLRAASARRRAARRPVSRPRAARDRRRAPLGRALLAATDHQILTRTRYREPAYRAELDRRSRILTGRTFTPAAGATVQRALLPAGPRPATRMNAGDGDDAVAVVQ